MKFRGRDGARRTVADLKFNLFPMVPNSAIAGQNHKIIDTSNEVLVGDASAKVVVRVLPAL